MKIFTLVAAMLVAAVSMMLGVGCAPKKPGDGAATHGDGAGNAAGEAAQGASDVANGGETGAPDAANSVADTGPLTEAQFKALHAAASETPVVLHGTMVDLAGGKAYLALPAGEGPHPGLVVIQEWWGLNDHIKHWADRLAADGYAALAVDLYDGKQTTDRDEAYKLMTAVPEARAKEILAAAHAFLKADPRIAAPKTGSIGWCFGGGWSLQLALAEPDLDAAVIYYGHLVEDPAALGAIKAKICGVFGNQDEGIPPAAVDAFEKGLQAAGVTHEIHRYDAPHAFANPSNSIYDEVNAGAAWEKVRAFLAANMKA